MRRRFQIERLERRELMAEGSLLTTFGNQGVIRDSNFHALTPNESIAGMVAKPGGGFYAGGSVYSGRANIGFVVAYLSDGSLDKSFGKDGQAFVPLASGNEWQTNIGLQPDGQIIVAGFVRDSTLQATSRIALSRIKTNGSIDLSFGKNGVVIQELEFHAGPTAVAVRPTGEILVYGDGASQLHLIQFLPDGSIDTEFGAGGITTIEAGGSIDGSDLLLLPDGSALISASKRVTDSIFEAQVYRVSADGGLNSSFGQGGKLRMPVAANIQDFNIYGLPLPLAPTPDGNFILAGTFRDYLTFDFFATKFTINGTIVNAFGSNGLTTIDVNGGEGTAMHDIVVRGNGEIVGLGYISDGKGIATSWLSANGSVERMTRVDRFIDTAYHGSAVLTGGRVVFGTTSIPLTTNIPQRFFEEDLQLFAFDVTTSQLDNSFGQAGVVTKNTKNTWSRSRALSSIELPGGQVLVAIEDALSNKKSERPLLLKRYTAQGKLDTTFGDQGKKTVLDYLIYGGNLEPKLVQNSNGIFLVVVNAMQLQIAKLDSTGNADMTWGTAGWLTWDFSNIVTYVQDVLIDSNAIYFGGVGGVGESYRVGKLDLNGTLQTAFGVAGLAEISAIRIYAGSGIRLSLGTDKIVALIANHSADAAFSVSLAAFNLSGQIDTSFGTGGRQVTGLVTGAALDLGRDVIVLPNNKILVYGKRTLFGGGGNARLERYLPNGQIDTTFGSSGSIELLDGPFRQETSEVVVDSKGRIAVLRTLVDEVESITAVTRLTANGVLDSAFGVNGTSQLKFDVFSEVIPNMTVASLDDLLISGLEVGLDDSHVIVAKVIGSENSNASWHNLTEPFDTNSDSTVGPVDALLVINYLNSIKSRKLTSGRPRSEYLVDVNNDGSVSPIDALLVINRLNSRASGEGESAALAQNEPEKTGVIDFSTLLTEDAEWAFKKRRK